MNEQDEALLRLHDRAYRAGMEAAAQIAADERDKENAKWDRQPLNSMTRVRCCARTIFADEIVSAIRKAKEES